MLHGPWTTIGAPLEGAVSCAAVVGQVLVQNVPAAAAWFSSDWSWIALSIWFVVVLFVVTFGGWIWPLFEL